MIAAGLNHFRATDFYARIVPPQLPWPRAIVYASGVVEAALGAMLFVPSLVPVAAWGLIVTFVAIFPANIYMATSTLTAHPAIADVKPWIAWVRLPFQALFIAWAWSVRRARRR